MNDTKWKPGQSGNPGGRPKMPDDLKKSCRRLADLGVEKLERRMRYGRMPTEDMIRFTKLMLEYGYGKPVQPLEGKDGGPITVVVRKFEDSED
jgi:hypothetical protein